MKTIETKRRADGCQSSQAVQAQSVTEPIAAPIGNAADPTQTTTSDTLRQARELLTAAEYRFTISKPFSRAMDNCELEIAALQTLIAALEAALTPATIPAATITPDALSHTLNQDNLPEPAPRMTDSEISAARREIHAIDPRARNNALRYFWAAARFAEMPMPETPAIKARRMAACSRWIGRFVDSTSEMTAVELERVGDALGRGQICGNWVVVDETFAVKAA